MRIPTIAVLTGPQPVDGDGLLRTELAAIGATVVDADGPAAAARAVASASAAGRVALVDRRLVAHRHALRLAIDDPRWQAAHSVGVLTVSGPARELLATQLRTLPDLTAHRVAGPSPAARLTAPRPLVPDALAAELAGAMTIHEVALPPGLIATLVDSPLSARKDAYERVATTDGEAIRLHRAVKSDDDLFTTVFVSSYSRYLARWFAHRGLTPNVVRALSVLVALVAVFTAALGTRAGYVSAAVAMYASFVLACTDGQLARYSLKFSRVDSWFDATLDRAKEYAVYAGLAFGSARAGDEVWLFAALAMALQTVRHQLGFAFEVGTRVDGEGERAAEGGGERERSVRNRGEYWARQVVVLPTGERWALIAVLTALTTPRTTFIALLIWGLLAGAYTTYGRVRRSMAESAPRGAKAVDALYAMCDILARPKAEVRRLTAQLGWLVPPTYHALEYGIAIALAAEVHGAMPLAFVYLAAVVYHHYDIAYRIRAAAPVPRWLTVNGALGFEGRVIILVVASFIPATPAHHVLTYVFLALAVYLWVLYLAESVLSQRSQRIQRIQRTQRSR